MYNAMMNDADELYRMEWNEQRMGRDSARSKEIPRAHIPVMTGNTEKPRSEDGSQLIKDAPTASDASRTPPRTRGASREGATVRAAPEPSPGTPRAVDVPAEKGDIPIGYAEDIINSAVDDDVNMEDEMTPLIRESSDDDVGPAGSYDNDTDSDNEVGGDEPPIKKAREIYALAVAGAIGVLPDETAVETPKQQIPRQQTMEELKSLMATAEVKRILTELEEQSELQLPRQSKKQPRLARWIKDCAEVYSPPRITEVANRIEMKSAWALDLTTLDEEGNPWDFSLPHQRKKAMDFLNKDKPLFLVTCPMCGPFSSINDLNYGKTSEEEIRKKLQDAMMHMRFALSLCLMQFAEGRMLMFEHPAGASS